MIKTIRLILIFGFFCMKVSAQDSKKYHKEEFNVINDLFIQLIDTGYYYNDWLIPLMPEQYLAEIALKPEENRDNLDWGDKEYYPFEYSKKLIETKGDYDKLQKFYADFREFQDSLKSQYDSRRLLIFVTDSLYQISNKESEDLKEVSRIDSTLLNSLQLDKYVTRYIDFNKIENHSRFEITNDKYPDQKTRIQTNDIKEIGLITCSRVIFNTDLTKGFFFYTFFKNGLNAYGLILIVEKVDGLWRIKHEIGLWVS
ncbi:hypothetical protein [Labilibaculum sp.]|uniref:hypothetical protein n=1 Tax=Labilibaculum sp. TaxID=2060723 RepID=UPI002AA8E4DB|nr:hypothetical protein [Labilibaculum sp.]